MLVGKDVQRGTRGWPIRESSAYRRRVSVKRHLSAWSISLVLAALCWPQRARAVPTRYDAFDLAQKVIMVQSLARPQAERLSQTHLDVFINNRREPTCTARVVGTQLMIAEDSCKLLWQREEQAALSIRASQPGGTEQLVAELLFHEGTTNSGAAEYDAQQGEFALDGEPPDGELAFFSPDRGEWRAESLRSGRARLHSTFHVSSRRSGAFYVRASGAAPIYKVAWRRAAPPSPPVPAEPLWTEPQCKAAKEQEETGKKYDYLVCLDATQGNTPQLIVYPDGLVIRPNQLGLLLVRRLPDQEVVATIDGSIGMYVPEIRRFQPASALAAMDATGPPPRRDLYTAIPIAPRLPGSSKIQVKLIGANDAAKVIGASQPIELIVDKTYSGAFRVGVAGILAARDRTFESKRLPGSNQAEVVVSAQTPVELVLAYSMFLDGFGKNGRSYHYPREGSGPYLLRHLGLLIGFGVLSLSGDKTDWLKSLHAGLEWEFHQNLSIAATFTLRRVTELADGVLVGSAVPDGGLPTHTTYRPGAALVLTFSPDLFRLASQLTK